MDSARRAKSDWSHRVGVLGKSWHRCESSPIFTPPFGLHFLPELLERLQGREMDKDCEKLGVEEQLGRGQKVHGVEEIGRKARTAPTLTRCRHFVYQLVDCTAISPFAGEYPFVFVSGNAFQLPGEELPAQVQPDMFQLVSTQQQRELFVQNDIFSSLNYG
ncbi:hypothetical protein J5N97_000615 [Dioscorea zingiberensis]|uniref:Uncharacterized protein n=1 Tax=Dioscorea zingiberensis TaxID=325984 RepID=A0A9D5BRV2_9LILI|nr:hypothetical protein J5N97_000615 [Dioscorea zingiberensis]